MIGESEKKQRRRKQNSDDALRTLPTARMTKCEGTTTQRGRCVVPIPFIFVCSPPTSGEREYHPASIAAERAALLWCLSLRPSLYYAIWIYLTRSEVEAAFLVAVVVCGCVFLFFVGRCWQHARPGRRRFAGRGGRWRKSKKNKSLPPFY